MLADASGHAVAIAQYLPGGPVTLSLGVTSANVQLKPFTAYRLWSSVNCFFDTGNVNVAATLSSHPITAGLDILHVTDAYNVYLAGIVALGSGTLFISQLNVAVN